MTYQGSMHKLLKGLSVLWKLYQSAISQGEKDQDCQGVKICCSD